MNNLPFKEEKRNEWYIRTFSDNINDDELLWHYDNEDRTVITENETDWSFQFENKLPFKIKKNVPIYIKKGEFHRLIKGSDNLVIKIKKE